MKRFCTIFVLAAGLLHAWPAGAETCANTAALGTWRTIEIDPAMLGRIGTMQYRQTVPLEPKEVVLTFDDGPMPPMTNKVLDILRAECVRATFFLIGRNAKAFPALVRQIARDGHTIANHTQNHPLVHMSFGYAVREFDTGFRTIAAALEPEGGAPAPFIRFPGLFNVDAVETHLNGKGISVLSADFLADDWLPISPEQVLARGLARLQQKGSGVMLLHDVQPRTALILPKLLQELKARGYRIVHIVPAPGSAPAVTPEAIAVNNPPQAPAAKPAPAASRTRKPAAAVAAATTQAEPTFAARWRKFFEDQKRAAASGPARNDPNFLASQ